jgi:hypothetical protein
MQVFIARLHPDKIALYEQIHDGMTQSHADSIRRGYEPLDIYRRGDLLVMLTERKPGPPPEPTAEEKATAERWHASLAECFAEFWQPADEIFSLVTAGR